MGVGVGVITMLAVNRDEVETGDGEEVMMRSFALVCRICRAMMAGASAPRILLGKVYSGGKANVGTTPYVR